MIEKTPADMWFEGRSAKLEGTIEAGSHGIIVDPAQLGGSAIRFIPWKGTLFLKPIATWWKLSTGGAIPITLKDTMWQDLGDGSEALVIRPGWPAEFAIFVRCQKTSDSPALRQQVWNVLADERFESSE